MTPPISEEAVARELQFLRRLQGPPSAFDIGQAVKGILALLPSNARNGWPVAGIPVTSDGARIDKLETALRKIAGVAKPGQMKWEGLDLGRIAHEALDPAPPLSDPSA